VVRLWRAKSLVRACRERAWVPRGSARSGRGMKVAGGEGGVVVVVVVVVVVAVDVVEQQGEVGVVGVCGMVIVRDGFGVGSAFRAFAAAVTVARLLVLVALLLLLCEAGVEDGGVGGRALKAKRSKPAVDCCRAGLPLLFSYRWRLAGSFRTNVAVFLLFLDPGGRPTGLGSGSAVSEATLRFHLRRRPKLAWLLELLDVLAKTSFLEIVLECWPSASDRSMRVVVVPARLLLPDVDLDDVVEMQLPIANVCAVVLMLRVCSDGGDV